MPSIEEFYASFEPLREQVSLGETALSLAQAALKAADAEITAFVPLESGRQVAVQRIHIPMGDFVVLAVDVSEDEKAAIPKKYAYVKENTEHPKLMYDLGNASGPPFDEERDREAVAAIRKVHDTVTSQ